MEASPVQTQPAAQPTPPQSVDVPIQQSPKRSPILLVLLSLLILLLLSSTAFLGYQNMQLQKQIVTSQIQPSPIPTTKQIPADPTANWKTYTSEAYSFQYPVNNWKIFKSYILVIDCPTCENFVEQSGINIMSTNSETTFADRRKHLQDAIAEGQIITVKETIFNSMPALTAYTIKSPESPNEYSIFLIHNNRGYLISMFEIPTKGGVIDQILSTFRFIDQKTTTPYTCPLSGWVNCMPSPDGDKPECSPEAMTWYKANCPDFKGGAR